MREWDGREGEKQQASLSQRKGKCETLKKTNPSGTESHPSIKHRLSEYFFPELNSLMELKEKKKNKPQQKQLSRQVKSAPTPTHSQQAMISSNCK